LYRRRISVQVHFVAGDTSMQHTMQAALTWLTFRAGPHLAAACPSCSQVFLLSYPYQEQLKEWDHAAAASASCYAMPADLFYRLHPFHLLLDEELRVLQAGWALGRVAPGLVPGEALTSHFRVRAGARRTVHSRRQAIVAARGAVAAVYVLQGVRWEIMCSLRACWCQQVRLVHLCWHDSMHVCGGLLH
jgi:hypothetical protein